MYNGAIPKTETVVQCVCASMSQEDIIIFSHVFICVYVVSLITKLFCELKPLSLLRKRRFKLFPKRSVMISLGHRVRYTKHYFFISRHAFIATC